jgi:hypothetical protein
MGGVRLFEVVQGDEEFDDGTAGSQAGFRSLIDEIVRDGARQMLAAALKAEVEAKNPIESTFATVCLRSRVTKGPGSRAAGLAMAFKPIEAAEDAGAP